MVESLPFNAGDRGSIPGQETKVYCLTILEARNLNVKVLSELAPPEVSTGGCSLAYSSFW